MNTPQRPQRAFLTVTMLTVLAVTTVFIAYAAILATYLGGNVIVTQPGGQIQYTKDNTSNSSWTGTLSIVNGSKWYTRINITDSGAQTVNLYWRLIKDSVDQGVKVSTLNYVLKTGPNTIYASTTGLFAGMDNWGQWTGSAGTYQVKVEVDG